MNILQKQTKNVFRVSRIFYFNSNTRMNAMTSHLRWKFDITKGQGIGKICLVLLGFVLILVFYYYWGEEYRYTEDFVA